MKHKLKMLWQKFTRGYSDEEWFNACDYIAAYSLPLVKELRNKGRGHPNDTTSEEWNKILDEIIWGLKKTDDEPEGKTTEEIQRYFERRQKAMELFGKYFYSLWNRKMPSKHNLISKCCGTKIFVAHGCDSDIGHGGRPCDCDKTGVTMWYVCEVCNKPCDTKPYIVQDKKLKNI